MDGRIARGANFLFAREFICREQGDAFWEELLGALPAEAAEEWRRPLLPMGSYSFPAFKALMATYADRIHAGNDVAVSRVYEYIADRSLNAMYKVFFHFAQPAFAIGKYPQLWSRFFGAGSVVVPVAESGHAVVGFELPEMFSDWLPPACLGYSRKAVEMAGGHDLRMRQLDATPLPDGQFRARFELRWQE